MACFFRNDPVMNTLVSPPPSCNVCTPAVLAEAIVRALGDAPDARWLEPCVGRGALLEALTGLGVDPRRIFGLDLCRVSEPADAHAVVRRGIEFLQWSLSTNRRFDRIVANPPYVALSKVPPLIQDAALAILDPAGARVARGANCWHAFLCASLRLLNVGGSMAFVLPAAFDFANYARSLRDALPDLFARVEVHRCRRPVFKDVDDGSIVLIARGFQRPNVATFRCEYETLDDLVRGLCRSSTSARPVPRPDGETVKAKGIRLGDIISIGLGAVTGDASYFLLTDEQRRHHGLLKSAVVPVVSKSKHIRVPTLFPEHWGTLLSELERIWLFRPCPSVLSHPAVQRYLRLSEADGGCRRDARKIRSRSPWYLTPLPPRPHGFISGMSQVGPWICLNETPRLSATNTLYAVRFRRRLPPHERYAWALMLLTSEVREQLPSMIRDYALGLAKLEPGDLAQLRLPAPRVVDAVPAVYRSAVEALLDSDVHRACSIADKQVAKRTENPLIVKVGSRRPVESFRVSMARESSSGR